MSGLNGVSGLAILKSFGRRLLPVVRPAERFLSALIASGPRRAPPRPRILGGPRAAVPGGRAADVSGRAPSTLSARIGAAIGPSLAVAGARP